MKDLFAHVRQLIAVLVSVVLAFPGMAYAQVSVDGVELVEGTNAIGGGTITYADGVMGVESVTAETVSTDESLSVSFIGQNEIDTFQVTGDASVAVGFSGENSVEDIEAYDTSNVVVNMDSNNEFQDLEANDSSSLTVRVTGEVSCEAIKGYDDASVTVEGTTSPTGDKIVVGEGEDSERMGTECGDLVVRDVSVVMEAEEAAVASEEGNVYVYNSSIEGGYSNERTDIYAGGELYVDESVVNVTGTMRSSGELTLRASDVDVHAPKGDDSPWRIWSETAINLIEEVSGQVKDGMLGEKRVKYLQTDGYKAGEKVSLLSIGKPRFYVQQTMHNLRRDDKLPATADASDLATSVLLVECGLVIIALDLRRRLSASAQSNACERESRSTAAHSIHRVYRSRQATRVVEKTEATTESCDPCSRHDGGEVVAAHVKEE